MTTCRKHWSSLALLGIALNASATMLYVDLNSSNPSPPYTNWMTAATNIQDAIDAANPNDLVLVTNGVYQSGGRVVYGSITNRVALTKTVVVQSVNGPAVTWIEGRQPVSANAVRCAYLTNGSALIGFTLTNGATRNAGDSLHEWHGGGAWCESAGAALSNCVLAGNSAYANAGGVWSGTLQSCVIVSNVATASGGGAYGSALSGCTVLGNTVGRGDGGGAYGSTLTNCTLSGNIAGYGGGAANCTLYQCTVATNLVLLSGGGCYNSTSILCAITGNTAISGYGGGTGGGSYGGYAYNCLLAGNTAIHGGGGYGGLWYNCTLAANIATNSGGGVDGGTGAWLYNCIAYYNVAPTGPDLAGAKTDYTCTTPPVFGGNNFTNQPGFVDAAAGNYHLQPGSPCINSGANSFVATSMDLDGQARIVGGAVDMGAYEFPAPGFTLPYLYARYYGIPTDGSADADGDGLNAWQEWIAGTNPTNGLSVLLLLPPTNNSSGRTITWQSVAGVHYNVQRSTNLCSQPAFSSIQSNILSQAGITSVTDTNAPGPGPYFYRVGVQQ